MKKPHFGNELMKLLKVRGLLNEKGTPKSAELARLCDRKSHTQVIQWTRAPSVELETAKHIAKCLGVDETYFTQCRLAMIDEAYIKGGVEGLERFLTTFATNDQAAKIKKQGSDYRQYTLKNDNNLALSSQI